MKEEIPELRVDRGLVVSNTVGRRRFCGREVEGQGSGALLAVGPVPHAPLHAVVDDVLHGDGGV